MTETREQIEQRLAEIVIRSNAHQMESPSGWSLVGSGMGLSDQRFYEHAHQDIPWMASTLRDALAENERLRTLAEAQVIPIVGGKPHRCACGANVFRLGSSGLVCNACGAAAPCS